MTEQGNDPIFVQVLYYVGSLDNVYSALNLV